MLKWVWEFNTHRNYLEGIVGSRPTPAPAKRLFVNRRLRDRRARQDVGKFDTVAASKRTDGAPGSRCGLAIARSGEQA
jgi:hypothetical protein